MLRTPRRMGAKQFGLQTHQRAVAGREMDDRLHADLVLDQVDKRQRAHPYARHGRIGDIDRVDSRSLSAIARRRSLSPGSVPSAGRFRPQTTNLLAQLFAPTRSDLPAAINSSIASPPADAVAAAALDGVIVAAEIRGGRVERGPHRRDVLRRRAATAADQVDTPRATASVANAPGNQAELG